MLSKILSVGNKVELKKVANPIIDDLIEIGDSHKTYFSQIYDIMDDNRMKIGMPIEAGKVIPLEINFRYDCCFYTTNGLYQCRVVVVDRYKEGSIYVLVVEAITELQKYQRRQYYRLGCTLDIRYRILDKHEFDEFMQTPDKEEYANRKPMEKGVALDISGGGVRFTSEREHKKNDEMFLLLEINYDGNEKIYGILGRIISCEELKNKPGTYEYRVEYRNMQGGVREELIKYIFDEERKRRKRIIG